MTRLTMFFAASAAIAGLAAPAAAQSAYPYPYAQPYPQAYPQQYPQAYPQQYPQSSYGYPGQPGYGAQNPVGAIINQLLGNRYNVTDRTAVSQCATAAMTQAAAQYGNGYNNGYRQGYPQQHGYNNGYGAMRVTAITDVQRRNRGLRVSGLLASGYGAYGNQGYADPRYGVRGDLSFRCNVDYRGAVTNVRIRRA